MVINSIEIVKYCKEEEEIGGEVRITLGVNFNSPLRYPV
jgi:hypothetical protein